MKSYQLSLYWKQGDDFAACVANTSTISAALQKWGDAFKNNAEVCNQIADAISGKNIVVEANTHVISFEPGDKAAEETLARLAEKELLSINAFDEGE